MATDALGLPVHLIGTPGQRNNIALAHDLVDGFEAGAIIADKGYDADHFVGAVAETGTEVVTPSNRNRKIRRAHDGHLYPERDAIERFFCRLKQFRRVATRYNRFLANLMGFVKLAAIAIRRK